MVSGVVVKIVNKGRKSKENSQMHKQSCRHSNRLATREEAIAKLVALL